MKSQDEIKNLTKIKFLTYYKEKYVRSFSLKEKFIKIKPK